jgi:hypothetical protein
MKWKPDWDVVKAHHAAWWRREGLVVAVRAPAEKPLEVMPKPVTLTDPRLFHTDPAGVCDRQMHGMSRTFHGGDGFPMLLPLIGPGSLGLMLGARPGFSFDTVWYEPCIDDPDAYSPIVFSPRNNPWWDAHLAMIDEGLRRSGGRFIVGMPDLIENLDTLAALRGTEALLADLLERPAWVESSLEQINQAFFAAFDLLYARIKESEGGNGFVFGIWGPGRTAKVQCDFCCMISPAMFKQFVAPPLTRQCQWLDYSMYHLDGETALQHLPALLSISDLDAIEWTPVGAGLNDPAFPRGGSPKWYDLYRRIRQAGKGVQAIGVKPDEVVPLIEAVGPAGLYVACDAPDQQTAEKVLEKVKQYH